MYEFKKIEAGVYTMDGGYDVYRGLVDGKRTGKWFVAVMNEEIGGPLEYMYEAKRLARFHKRQSRPA